MSHHNEVRHVLLGALPVCPMALLVFIDFFTEVQAPLSSARLRGKGQDGRQGSRPGTRTTSRPNLQKVSPSALLSTFFEFLPAAKPLQCGLLLGLIRRATALLLLAAVTSTRRAPVPCIGLGKEEG